LRRVAQFDWHSVRVCFLSADAPTDIRRRAEQIALRWNGWITWHPEETMVDGHHRHPPSEKQPAPDRANVPPARSSPSYGPTSTVAAAAKRSGRARGDVTTQVGNVNRNDQEASDQPARWTLIMSNSSMSNAAEPAAKNRDGSDIHLKRRRSHDPEHRNWCSDNGRKSYAADNSRVVLTGSFRTLHNAVRFSSRGRV
jgi:hypothetical protein